MKKYLAYYENEWPANIAELTAVENKPFVGYLKGEGVLFTVIPEPVVGPADNEIWYTTTNGVTVTPQYLSNFGAGFVENVYENGKGVLRFNGPVTHIPGNSNSRIGVADPDGAFYYCTSLTSITIPNSVTSIGEDAFYGCSGLTSVTIPNSVMSIGGYAFRGCYGLTFITIPNNVTSIGEYAFYGCSGLTSVTIPNSVTSIGEKAFSHCSRLTSVTLGNSVTRIGNYAFDGCSSLTSITIPNSVTSIGYSAFSHCSSLTSIVVNDENTKYDNRENCNAIIETATNTLIAGCQNTIIPNSVTSIGSSAFSGRRFVASITIPSSVTRIGDGAFTWCTGLTFITFEGTMEEWNSITKGSMWNYEASATHVQCTDGQIAL